jgi:hypothetical protein
MNIEYKYVQKGNITYYLTMGQSPVHISAINLHSEQDGPAMNLAIKIHTLRTISNSSIKPSSYRYKLL